MLYLCADPSAAQPAPLGQCLDTILLSPDAGACFDYLEEQGLLLGNGGFLLTLLCPREGLVLPGQESFCADVARAFRTHLPPKTHYHSKRGLPVPKYTLYLSIVQEDCTPTAGEYDPFLLILEIVGYSFSRMASARAAISCIS